MTKMNRRAFALIGGAAAFGARAQTEAPARRVAVVSEMARELHTVLYGASVGTRLGGNSTNSARVQGGALDKLAVLTADRAVRAAAPGTTTWLLEPMDSNLFEGPQVFDSGRSVVLPEDIASEARQRSMTHLLLFTPWRTEARLQGGDSELGTGTIGGTGFFVDNMTRMYERGGNFATGYIAPFLYAKAVLFDVPAKPGPSRMVAVESLRLNRLYINIRPDSGGPTAWESLTNKEKVQVIVELIEEAIAASVPKLMAAR